MTSSDRYIHRQPIFIYIDTMSREIPSTIEAIDYISILSQYFPLESVQVSNIVIDCCSIRCAFFHVRYLLTIKYWVLDFSLPLQKNSFKTSHLNFKLRNVLVQGNSLQYGNFLPNSEINGKDLFPKPRYRYANRRSDTRARLERDTKNTHKHA